MPEGLGESRPTPLPRVGQPEGSVAGDYAETPWRPRFPAVRPAPYRGRKTQISYCASSTPCHADGKHWSRLVIGMDWGLGGHRHLIACRAKREA
jgi:hypothetical protein